MIRCNRHSSTKWVRVIAGVSALATGLAIAMSGPAGGTSSDPVATQTASPPPHVMTIMMENTDASQFAGSPAMPYLNELAHQYADFTQAYGWHYPSLPNYLELLSGSHEGVNRDCNINDKGCSGFTEPTLVDQMEAAGITWHAYYQGLDAGCDQGNGSGYYPYWHNPFRYFADFATQCSHISNFKPFLSDLSGAHAADYDWVVPDLVNSGGDNGTMASGDNWLSTEVPQIMDTPWYRQGGQIVILYDTGYEDSGGVGGASAGQIPMVVVSAHTAGMGAVSTPVTTAGVLRSVEHAYGLPYLGDAANPVNGSLGDAVVAGLPTGPTPSPLFHGDVVTARAEATVTGVGGTLSLNGVATTASGSYIEVGQNSAGQGVVVTSALGTLTVPNTTNLQSVSCETASRCFAVGIGPVDRDDAVMVAIVNGEPIKATQLPTFNGLYGISCPTATTCYAVGYDSNDDADAVTTITAGHASAPAEVPGGGEWLNAISCPSATQCYAAGLVNYNPSIDPIVSGIPQTALTVPDAWYLNGIDCPSVGSCLAVGENATQQGIVATLSSGAISSPTVVSGTEYLYGVGCDPDGSCLLAGASTPGLGYSSGVFARDYGTLVSGAHKVPGTNGLGQTICGVALTDCTSVGAGKS